jgi:carboxyl-terminal processing protease
MRVGLTTKGAGAASMDMVKKQTRGLLIVKQRFLSALNTFLIAALLLPGLALAQAPARRGTIQREKPVVTKEPRRAVNTTAEDIEKDVSEALTLIEHNYIGGNKLNYSETFQSSIMGMLQTLDPHSRYFTREEFDEFKSDQREVYYGIGASIINQTVAGKVDTYITATFEGSPASRAGLLYGDRIVAVNGADMRGKPSADVRDKIRGPKGSTVRVTVERAANDAPQTVEIIRDAVPQPSIPDAYMLTDSVGYIGMTQGFNYATAAELQQAMQDLKGKGMTSVVIDLRNNPGGFMEQAIRAAQLFLPAGQTILTQKGRNPYEDRTARSENRRPETMPVVVLQNGGSASASEIFAGALQDHDRALIIGQNSFGKGLVQGIFPIEYGAGLTLTTAKYYTPSGRLVQRDYSGVGYYDYITQGERLEGGKTDAPRGEERRTDTGRPVYSGGGIAPDEETKPRAFTREQGRAVTPVFAFVRDLVNGRIAGEFSEYKITSVKTYDHVIKPEDYPVTDKLFAAFKAFVARDPSWKLAPKTLDANRELLNVQIRFQLVTAAYGRVTADQVLLNDDPQLKKAVDALPRARELALMAQRARAANAQQSANPEK